MITASELDQLRKLFNLMQGPITHVKINKAQLKAIIDTLERDYTMDAWVRVTLPLSRRPKRHTIDEMVLLTKDLVDQDLRMGSFRKAVRGLIEEMNLHVTIMGTMPTKQDWSMLLNMVDGAAMERRIYQMEQTK